MTAEPSAEPTSAHGHRWPMPPQDGYTVDDLFTLPDLPPHTELIDGSLVFVSPQRNFHSLMVDLLVAGLRRTVPGHLKIRREMTIVLDRRNGPEPDVSVLRTEAEAAMESGGWRQTRYQASDVALAIEVVSPDSEARDHDTKPRKYAAAGIPHFWLVEMDDTDPHPVIQVFELDRINKAYALGGIHHDRLKLTAPYDIDIDISLDALKAL